MTEPAQPTAKEKFKKGDRVRISAEGVRTGVACYSGGRGKKGIRITTGVVVGFPQAHNSPYAVRIRPDKHRTAVTHHMDFWELDTSAEAEKAKESGV